MQSLAFCPDWLSAKTTLETYLAAFVQFETAPDFLRASTHPFIHSLRSGW